MDLSPRQKDMLNFMGKFVEKNGYPPTIREIGRAVDISSTSVVDYNLNILQAKGLIQRDRAISRGVKLLDKGLELQRAGLDQTMVRVPILGRIVAGEPVPILDESSPLLDVEESISLTRDIVQEQGLIYALQVKGDSMKEDGIFDGDFIVVKKQPTAENGETVVALINNEATVKRFYKQETYVELRPAHTSIEPIIVQEGDLRIEGKIVGVIRQYK